jgi:hypothetical protein
MEREYLKTERRLPNDYQMVDGAYRDSEYLTPEYVGKVDGIIASFDPRGGAYDPFLCAQDVPGEMRFETLSQSDDTAQVVVHEAWNPGTEYEMVTDVTAALNYQNGEWKIADIVCAAR